MKILSKTKRKMLSGINKPSAGEQLYLLAFFIFLIIMGVTNLYGGNLLWHTQSMIPASAAALAKQSAPFPAFLLATANMRSMLLSASSAVPARAYVPSALPKRSK